jgi:hypothetical protein
MSSARSDGRFLAIRTKDDHIDADRNASEIAHLCELSAAHDPDGCVQGERGGERRMRAMPLYT